MSDITRLRPDYYSIPVTLLNGNSTFISPYAFTIPHGDRVDLMFDPTPGQLPCLLAEIPNLFIVGNRGGGKSTLLRFLAHALAMSRPGLKYIIIRRSFPELGKTHLAYLEDELFRMGGEKKGFYYNRSDHVVRYPNGSLGFYAACAEPGDVRKIVGAEAGLIIFDEAPEMDWSSMVEIAASARVPEGFGYDPRVIYSGNPMGPAINDLWTYFIDKNVDPLEDEEYDVADWHHIWLNLEENPHLDAKKYRKRFAGLPANVVKAWRDGERVVDGALFDFRQTITVESADGSRSKRPYHVIETMPTVDGGRLIDEPWVQIYRAYDHGYHPDPAYVLWFAVYGRKVIAFLEQIFRRKAVKQIAREILLVEHELFGRPGASAEYQTWPEHLVIPSTGRVAVTYADPVIAIKTGQDVHSIQDTYNAWNIPMVKSVNSRETFVTAVHTLLRDEIAEKESKFSIFRQGCPYLIKALPRMRPDENNPLKMADHPDDHPPVTLAYYAMTQTAAFNNVERPTHRQPTIESRIRKELNKNKRVVGLNKALRRGRHN